MRSLLIAVAVVLAVLTVTALLIALAAARAAPLVERLHARWIRRDEAGVTTGRPAGKAGDRVGRDEAVVGLAATQGDDYRAADGGDGFGDGGAGAVDGGDGGG